MKAGMNKWVVESTFGGVQTFKIVYAKTARGAALSMAAGNASEEAIPTNVHQEQLAWKSVRTAHAVYGVFGPLPVLKRFEVITREVVTARFVIEASSEAEARDLLQGIGDEAKVAAAEEAQIQADEDIDDGEFVSITEVES